MLCIFVVNILDLNTKYGKISDGKQKALNVAANYFEERNGRREKLKIIEPSHVLADDVH